MSEATPQEARWIRREIAVVILITFGAAGVRAGIRLIDAVLQPTPLNKQSTTLTAPQSTVQWVDAALQITSASTLIGWGLLVCYLLGREGLHYARLRWSDGLWAAGLAAVIGIPGLGLYIVAVQFGWSREVIPSALSPSIYAVFPLLLWSFAHAFAEETVVLWWLITRLEQLGWPRWSVIFASAVLRGSYHLYQGVSAGFGNIAMGLLVGWLYVRTRRVWPVILAHFLIDAVAFIGYQFLDLSFLLSR